MDDNFNTVLPRHIVDLVCSLQENGLDDEAIIDISMRLFSSREYISRMILFLSVGEHTAVQIREYAAELTA